MSSISSAAEKVAVQNQRLLDSSRMFWVSVGLILLIALGLRLWNLGEPNLWTDEVATELRAQAPLDKALESFVAVGNQSPLYYFMLRLLPTDTEFLLRLPTVVLGVAGIALLMWVVHQIYQDRAVVLWVGALLAVSPFFVTVSRTARPYPLVFLLSIGSHYAFLRLLQGRHTWRIWGLFIGSSMFAYLTHYSMGALPVSQFIILVMWYRSDRRLLRNWFVAQLVAVTPFALWFAWVMSNFSGGPPAWVPTPTLAEIPVTIWNILHGYDGRFSWFLLPAMALVAVGLALGVRWALQRRVNGHRDVFWILLVVVGFVPVVGVSLLISPAYKDRYLTVVLPGLLLLFIMGWREFSPRYWHVVMGVVLYTSAFNTVALFASGDYIRVDWEVAVAQIQTGFQPGDGILFERENIYRTVMRYYDGQPEVHILLDQPDTTVFEAVHKRVWVIYRNPHEDFHRLGVMPDFDPFEPMFSPVVDWLESRRSQIVDTRVIRGVTLLLVDLRD